MGAASRRDGAMVRPALSGRGRRARFASPGRADDSRDGGGRAASGTAAETALPQSVSRLDQHLMALVCDPVANVGIYGANTGATVRRRFRNVPEGEALGVSGRVAREVSLVVPCATRRYRR